MGHKQVVLCAIKEDQLKRFVQYDLHLASLSNLSRVLRHLDFIQQDDFSRLDEGRPMVKETAKFHAITTFSFSLPRMMRPIL